MNGTRRGKELHEEKLQEYIKECEQKNIKIIDLAGKSPDAIQAELIDGKIVLTAVEVVPTRFSTSYNTWKKSWSYKNKQETYHMFDKVKMLEYKIPKKRGVC